jgi:hypothetical protein
MNTKTTGKRDSKAPTLLTVSFTDSNGKVWGSAIATAKTFSSGSVGFYASDKLVNPENPDARYQVGLNITLIGSKGA